MTADARLPLPDTYSSSEVALSNNDRWVRREDFDWHMRQAAAAATAARDAEIEALRAEVSHERWLREQAENVTEAERDARDAYKAQAERLAEALRALLLGVNDIRGIEIKDYCSEEVGQAEQALAAQHPATSGQGVKNDS